MYCLNETLYLEETAHGGWNVTELSANSTFCKHSFQFIRMVSIPLGVAIIVINILAFKAISNVVKQHSFGGNAVTLKGIACFDVGNGIFLLIYYLESAQGIFMKGDIDVWHVVVWLSWVCIYSSCLLRLYLCCQRLYSYAMLLYTGTNTHLIPGSQVKSLLICGALVLLANIELVTVIETKRHNDTFQKATHMYTIPFLVIQDVAMILVCVFSILLLLFSKLRMYDSRIWKAVWSLVLISTSSVLTNLVTFYGDAFCFVVARKKYSWFTDPPKPECFIPFAKTLTYFDSLFFPIIIFLSKNMRDALLDICCGPPREN